MFNTHVLFAVENERRLKFSGKNILFPVDPEGLYLKVTIKTTKIYLTNLENSVLCEKCENMMSNESVHHNTVNDTVFFLSSMLKYELSTLVFYELAKCSLD